MLQVSAERFYVFTARLKNVTDSLNGSGIEYRWGGARFSAPVQTDPGAHPASCTIDTGSFPRVKSGRSVTLTPHPLLSAVVMKE